MKALTAVLWFVVLISYAVCAGDDDCLVMKKRVLCYECSTKRGDRFCGDPFNTANPLAKAQMCDGYCVKWVQIPKAGVVHVTRTCSSKLALNLHLGLVCMKESRPGDGHMCFCNTKKCNSASSIKSAALLVIVTFVIATLLSPMTSLLDWSLTEDTSSSHGNRTVVSESMKTAQFKHDSPNCWHASSTTLLSPTDRTEADRHWHGMIENASS